MFALLAGLVLLGIIWLTQLPEEDKHWLHTDGRFHTAGHVLVFAALAFSAGRMLRSWQARLAMCVGLLAFGFGTEFAEAHSFGLEWSDVYRDGVGVLVGSLLAIFASRRRSVGGEEMMLS